MFYHQVKQVAIKVFRPTHAIVQGRKRRDNSAIDIEAGGQIDHVLPPS